MGLGLTTLDEVQRTVTVPVWQTSLLDVIVTMWFDIWLL